MRISKGHSRVNLRRHQGIRQQPGEFFFSDRIAFTGQTLHPGTVQHGDMAAPATDVTQLQQFLRRFIDAFPPDPQRMGHQVLCDGDFGVRATVQTLQQPSAQFLIDQVMGLANGLLRHLAQMRLRVT